MAYFGMLEDAALLFRTETVVPRVGVLLAVAALLQTGVVEWARKHLRYAGTRLLRPAFQPDYDALDGFAAHQTA